MGINTTQALEDSNNLFESALYGDIEVVLYFLCAEALKMAYYK